jgi:[protein-PII] uridylyltransferase
VLALHGLDVVSAAAHSSDEGRALSEFRVVDRMRGEPRWPRVERDLEAALDGRLALGARVAERIERYARRRPPTRRTVDVVVHFDDHHSETATIIDVHAPDGDGVLYRITRALTEFDLDIRSAHVQTLGHEVADAFYVVDRCRATVTDPVTRSEIERAILHALR